MTDMRTSMQNKAEPTLMSLYISTLRLDRTLSALLGVGLSSCLYVVYPAYLKMEKHQSVDKTVLTLEATAIFVYFAVKIILNTMAMRQSRRWILASVVWCFPMYYFLISGLVTNYRSLEGLAFFIGYGMFLFGTSVTLGILGGITLWRTRF